MTPAQRPQEQSPGLRARLAGLAVSSRPRQWPKNLLVLAALLFSREFHSGSSLLAAVAAMAIFTLATAGLYMLNDAIDASRDRQHPVKRHRPIAAGLVPVGLAVGVGALFSVAALALATLLAWPFGAALAVYLALQIGYSLVLKHLVILDLLAIAVGFVIRAVAGALVIEVPISPWLYICTFLLALFLAVGKRWAELGAEARSSAARPVLDRYTPEFLRTLIVITASATPLSYALYTFSAPQPAGEPPDDDHHPDRAVRNPAVCLSPAGQRIGRGTRARPPGRPGNPGVSDCVGGRELVDPAVWRGLGP